MLNRSLATFMNAFTMPDATVYPFATTNAADFRNLLGVYLDAAFFPQLKDTDFSQEGWRLEPRDLDDPASPLQIKGVVFNEVKGLLTSASTVFSRNVSRALMDGTSYAYDFGGHPLHIPMLRADDLRAFHAERYHPSNAYFATYGDMPLEGHLELIHEQTLRHFQARPELLSGSDDVVHGSRGADEQALANATAADPAAATPPRWTEPRRHEFPGPPAAGGAEEGNTVSLAFLLPPVRDTYGTFCLRLLSSLLMDGTHTPFFELVGSKGADYSPGTGFDAYTSHARFEIGLQGVRDSGVDEVESAILDILRRVAQEGFRPADVEACLHQQELATRVERADFGLDAVFGSITLWRHGAHVGELLQPTAFIERFRQDYAENPRLLQDLLQRHLLDNTHRLTSVMRPAGASYMAKAEEEEKALLEKLTSGLGQADVAELRARGQELRRLQDSTSNDAEADACLPTLSTRDIPRQRTFYPSRLLSEGGEAGSVPAGRSGRRPVHVCEQLTNGACHFRAVLPMEQSLPPSALPLLPHFADVWAACGAGDMNHATLSAAGQAACGGLEAGFISLRDYRRPEQAELGVRLSSVCLQPKLHEMFRLWTDVLSRPHLHDADYLRRHLQGGAVRAANEVASNGSFYAASLANALLSPVGRQLEAMRGASSLHFAQALAATAENNFGAVEAGLRALHRATVRQALEHARFHFVADDEAMPEMERALNACWEVLETAEVAAGDESFTPDALEAAVTGAVGGAKLAALPEAGTDGGGQLARRVAVPGPFEVGYSCLSIPSVPAASPDYPVLCLALKLAEPALLHREIREKGGAYGCGAGASNGFASFSSMRDPSPERSLGVFHDAAKLLREGGFTGEAW
jgi:Zn-dependent M16 (insulinase) family peptidase